MKNMPCWDSKLGLEDIKSTMPSMFLDGMSRRNQGERSIAGRGATMVAKSERHQPYRLPQLLREGDRQGKLPHAFSAKQEQ